MADTDTIERPEVRIKPRTYQPSKAELEESFVFDATPEEVIRAAFQQVRVVEDPDA